MASSGLFSDSAVSYGAQGNTSQLTLDIRNNGVLVHAHAQNLTLPVHTENTVCLLVRGRGEDGVSGNSVHVDTLTSLDLVEVNETEFRDEVDDTVLGGDLH